MDTTKEYIKMCEKAEEIQKKFTECSGQIIYSKVIDEYKDIIPSGNVFRLTYIWKSKLCDCKRTYYTKMLLTDFTGNVFQGELDKFVWLPRQDQLHLAPSPRPVAGDGYI